MKMYNLILYETRIVQYCSVLEHSYWLCHLSTWVKSEFRQVIPCFRKLDASGIPFFMSTTQ